MSKIRWVWTMVLVAAALMVIPSAGAETTERMWLVLGQEYNLTGTEANMYPSITGDVRVEPGEVVTINWWNVTNVTRSGWNSVTLASHIPSLNWSSNLTVSGVVCKHTFWNNTSGSAWLRAGGYDVVSVDMEWICGYNSSNGRYLNSTVSFNITVTRDDYSFGPNTNGLEDKIIVLQDRLDAFDIDALRASIRDLQVAQVALNDNIKSLRELIGLLQVQVNQQGISGSDNDTVLSSALVSLNASLSENLRALEDASALNDAMLEAGIALLDEKVSKLPTNGTITNTTTIVPNDYNDTALWDEIARLKATPLVTVFNNTTEIRPTTLTYQNKTVTQKDEANIAPAVVAGVAAGGAAAVVTVFACSGRGRRADKI